MLSSLRQVASLLISTFIMMTGFGVAGYITPLRAMDEGWSMLVISVIATFYSVGFFAASFGTPWMVRRVGHIRAFATFIGLLTLSILLAALIVDWRLWMGLRLITGFSMAGVYMVIETWLNERADNNYRGALFSVYMITTTGGAICGQFMVPWGDRSNTSLFILSAILYGAALLPITLSKADSPALPAKARINLRQLWERTPVAYVGAVITGILNAAWVAMATVYTTRIGMDAQAGAELQAAVILGSTVMQVPIGRLSDIIDRRIVMVAAGFVGVGSSIAMVMISPDNWLAFHAAAFVMGAVQFPIYSLNSAHANDMAGKGEIVSVSATLALLYGLGVIAGPFLSGQLMQWLGPAGMPVMLAAGFGLYGAYALWRILRRPARLGPDIKGDYRPVPAPVPGANPAALGDQR